MKKIPLSRPWITMGDILSVVKVLRTPYLSLGPKLREFEALFCQYIGRRFATAVSCGTAGLHLCIRAEKIGENDEVITTPFSFIASANCILFERGFPRFIDIDEKTQNISPERIKEFIEENCKWDGEILVNKKTGKRIRLMLIVHIFGLPCAMQEIMEIARKYNLRIIEDACEAIGATYKGQKVGTFGEASVFAFYPNKQITTGEGGIILTDDENLDKLFKSMRNQGRMGGGWLSHEILGYNYRISDINCALGISQMKRIEKILKKRKRIAQYYNQILKDIDEVITPAEIENVERSWFVYVIMLQKGLESKRDKLIELLGKEGIESKNYFPPIHLQPFYRKEFGFKEGDFPVTESVSKRTIALPFYTNLKFKDVEYVCDRLKKCFKLL